MPKVLPLSPADEKPLLYWKAALSSREWVSEMEPAEELLTLDPWILASGVQKSIRRGLPEAAVLCAKALWKVERTYVLHRLAVSAAEDIGNGNLDFVEAFLASRIRKLFIEEAGGENSVAAMAAAAAESRKDRTSCLVFSFSEALPSEHQAKLPTLSVEALFSIIGDSERNIVHRVAALRSLAGASVRSKFSFSHPSGNPNLLIEALRACPDVPEKMIGITSDALAFQNEGHFYALPFLFDFVEKKNTPKWAEKGLELSDGSALYGCCGIPPRSETLIFRDAIPSTALDCHTRLGRNLWNDWVARTPVFSELIASAPFSDKERLSGKIQFALSGHESANTLSYPVSAWAHIRHQWELSSAMGIPWTAFSETFEVLSKKRMIFDVLANQSLSERAGAKTSYGAKTFR